MPCLTSTTVALLSASALVAAKYTFDPLEHLAGVAPYFEPESPAFDPAPPQGCNVTRAAYLVRHAAIFANDFDYETYIEPFVEKLVASQQSNSSVDWSRSSEAALRFLSDWQSPISDAESEKLTKIGQLEAFKLGIDVGDRYPDLADPSRVWTSTAERTVRSADSFISGIATSPNETQLIQVSEGEEEGADSLTPYEGCPAYSSSRGSSQSKTYQKIYTAPILSRLRAAVPSFNWTANDVTGMFELCGYESVIRGSSPFCSLELFSANEWLGFEYTNDIMYFQNTGYGNPISGVVGFPWVNATAQLLMSNANATGKAQDLTVSFTHRELPPTVLVALGLFNNSAFTGADDANATMPNDAINPYRAWQSSKILPFLTNIAVERMECDSYGYQDSSNSTGEYYRVLVNQSPQLLPGCVDGPGFSCSRDGFAKMIEERGQMFGDFSAKCGVDYKNSTDVLGIYSK
ncbi:hypothetical protein AAFC00_004516 [Neodothiora populina]|uniref:Phosphoglycerate mutase-like protein n=1 Tax=Neodothiora populina TaxID=2781224 RepID=A0ABR3P3M9_9PEZI